MKRLILSSLSILVLSSVGIAPAIHAQTVNGTSTPSSSTQVQFRQLNPFQLTNLARNGYFREQGIPSHAALVSAVQIGRVTADELIQAAIATNRLSAEVLNNSRYRYAVQTQLDGLVNDSSSSN